MDRFSIITIFDRDCILDGLSALRFFVVSLVLAWQQLEEGGSCSQEMGYRAFHHCKCFSVFRIFSTGDGSQILGFTL